MRLSSVVTTILAVSVLLAGCNPAGEQAAPAAPRVATVLPSPQPLPEFALIDDQGSEQTRAMFEGGWHLLFFGFTYCPDVCPTTLATLSAAVSELEETEPGSAPGIVLVSVDPDRDTPEKLAEYVAYFGPSNAGLTGSEDAIRALTEPLGIYFSKVDIPDGDYTVDHSAAVLLINPEGQFHALFSGPHRAEDYVHDLPLIMERS